ncbi:hypothetical protein [Dyella mobilis]|uniref:Uncharacterized protein n=1 Tax=Dyella mobilis TaxID=1849582 RepID=A0ABS2KMK3_9GAMM|nr:hypothetical protein [Dyella mobilis]MBM7132275.1 hypothetical protein [Dyella mobilis]GLQ95740.1 hypothetical protein GCM10007863_01580 [Dyella mobilis]
MNPKHTLLSLALAASSVQAGTPPTANPPRMGYLSCGGAKLVASTTYVDVVDQDWQTVAQRITLTPPGRSQAITLPHEGRPLHQPFLKHVPVLDATVTGWACITATDGTPYLYLGYTCTESPLRPKCEGDDREWSRLFDLNGKQLDAGYPHEGERQSNLMRKLGLGRYVTNGVSMSGISD